MSQLFDQLVSQQLETMDQLLFLQSELERCQRIEQELQDLYGQSALESIQHEISGMKKQLKEIQEVFQQQTEQIIQSYEQERNQNVSSTPSF
ncbi:YgaB family protein [Priestia koreensis]|uniref:YgaB family protein n=1 Tax=Priestia koreensis TaxID=284581 RepID=UPI00241246F7|nr:YgaB family protein [Priestia koreensis]